MFDGQPYNSLFPRALWIRSQMKADRHTDAEGLLRALKGEG